MNFGSASFYETSYQQAYSSVGTLAMVSVDQIKSDENIDYLEELCIFIEKMNINPLWFEGQQDKNKLKLLQIYQLAITYSKNLSHFYNSEIERLENKNRLQVEENEEKERQIKNHKQKYHKMKAQYKLQKLKHLRKIYEKEKIKEEEARSHTQQHHSHYATPPSYYPPYPYYPPPSPYAQHYPPNLGYPQPESFNPPPPNQYPPPMHPTPHQSGHSNATFHHPANIPGQPYPQQPHQLSAEQQIGINLFKQFASMGEKGQPRPEQKGSLNVSNQNKGILAVNTKKVDKQFVTGSSFMNSKNQVQGNLGINSKKIEKSFIKEDQGSFQQRNMDHSQIINKIQINDINQANSSKPGNQKKQYLHELGSSVKKDKKAAKEEEDFQQFGNLTAQSKKSFTKPRKQSAEQLSKHSNDSIQQDQFNSIAELRLDEKESKVQKDPFKSKLGPKSINTKNSNFKPNIPSAISPINQQSPSNDQLELPPNSSINKYSKNSSSDNNKLYSETPKRTSKIEKKESEKEEDELANDLPSINLNPVSKVPSKVKKEKDKPIQEFDGIAKSTRIKKNEEMQAQGSAEKMFNNHPPARKSNIKKNEQPNLLRISEANSESLGQTSKTKMMQSATVNVNLQLPNDLAPPKNEDYSNINNSNVGLRRGNETSAQRIFETRPPKRTSQHQQGENEAIRTSNVRTPPKLQKQPMSQVKQEQDQVKQEEENYEGEEFQDDQFDMDLQHSHLPISRQETGKKVEEVRQPLKSQVDIKVPSAQSINEVSKYFKLKGEEFILNGKQHSKKQKSRDLQESDDPFDDFIDTMPANSIIAKPSVNFKHKKQQKKPVAFDSDPKSLKDLPADRNVGNQKTFSINLISADHQKVKLLSKREQQEEQRQRQREQGDDLRSSGLPVIGGMIESKIVTDNSSNRLLGSQKKEERAKESLPVKPILMERNIQEQDQNSSDSLFEKKLQSNSSNSDRKAEKGESLNDHRKKMLEIIKRQVPKSSSLSADKFNNKLIEGVFEKVLKIQANTKSVQTLNQANNRLDGQIKRLKERNAARSKEVDRFYKQEEKVAKHPSSNRGLGEKEKPKIAKNASNNDSLNYSASYVMEKSQHSNKNPKVQIKPLTGDMTDSIVINNPYTPHENQSRYEETKKQNDKKQAKSSNPFLLQNNKSMGTKQQQNLIKNASQGISKYNKDDPLEREIKPFMNKQRKVEEDEEDEWN